MLMQRCLWLSNITNDKVNCDG